MNLYGGAHEIESRGQTQRDAEIFRQSRASQRIKTLRHVLWWLSCIMVVVYSMVCRVPLPLLLYQGE
jgi:preprotein translocase subunit SecY